jgi:hypothetical protein
LLTISAAFIQTLGTPLAEKHRISKEPFITLQYTLSILDIHSFFAYIAANIAVAVVAIRRACLTNIEFCKVVTLVAEFTGIFSQTCQATSFLYSRALFTGVAVHAVDVSVITVAAFSCASSVGGEIEYAVLILFTH